MKQCIFEYFKATEKARKGTHALNFTKYMLLLGTSLSFSIFQDSEMIIFGYFLAAISTILASYWDFVIDWGLGRKQIRNGFGFLLYIICLQNFVLRLTMIPLLSKHIFPTLILAHGFEIMRRVLWAYLRITNHLLDHESI